MRASERSRFLQAAILVLAVVVLLCLSLAAVSEMPHMAGVILCCFTLVVLVARAIIRRPVGAAVVVPPGGWAMGRPASPLRWSAPRAPDPVELGVLLN